jgi:hypothetical protein
LQENFGKLRAAFDLCQQLRLNPDAAMRSFPKAGF